MDPLNPGVVQPGDAQLTSSDPKPNDGQTPTASQAEALSLAELNSLLGREFKSKDSALKSIQDTYKFATTRVTDIASKVDDTTKGEIKRLADTLEAQTKEMFYLQHPEYAQHRKLIDGLGKNPAEVVQSDVFKEVYIPLKEHGETVKLKTVLESNPRLVASRDNLSKAAEIKQKQSGLVTGDVEALAVGAVLDAFNLR